MGTWANDPFGNDCSCDWAFDLVKKGNTGLFGKPGLSFIKATLEKALSSGQENLEAPDADEGIAAADTVARLRGHFYERNAYTQKLDDWVAKEKKADHQQLADLAVKVIERTQSPPSELLDLWEESGEAENWKQQMAALRERLLAPPKARES